MSRRYRASGVELQWLLARLPAAEAAAVRAAVEAGQSVVIAGSPPTAGRTTLLRDLMGEGLL